MVHSFKRWPNLIIKNIRSVTTTYSNKNASGKRNNRERWSLVIKFEGETHSFSQNETIVSNGNSGAFIGHGNWYYDCSSVGTVDWIYLYH